MKHVAVMLLAASLGSGCLSEEELSTHQPFCAPKGEDESYDDFRKVNGVLEKRCGTLDCHGDAARPFLVYGQAAIRRRTDTPPVDYYPGGAATTDFELEGTYQSICGLEPEKMDAVVKRVEAPETLTFVRKPRLQEKHKGGRIWDAGSLKGDACILRWLTGEQYTPQGELDTQPCDAELEQL